MEPTSTERIPVVYLIGDVDLVNAAAHGDLLCRLLDLGHGPELVVDCHQLEFIDSQAMAMMHRVHRRGVERGTRVRWTGLSPRLVRLLELTGLAGHLDVAHDDDQGAARSNPPE
jgi:anti-anti-sigma factor